MKEAVSPCSHERRPHIPICSSWIKSICQLRLDIFFCGTKICEWGPMISLERTSGNALKTVHCSFFSTFCREFISMATSSPRWWPNSPRKSTRDVAPKAKVLRCHEHHRRGGVSVGGGIFSRGWHVSMGGWHIPRGVTSILTWLMTGRGWHPWRGGGKQRSQCLQNHCNSNTTSRLFQRQRRTIQDLLLAYKLIHFVPIIWMQTRPEMPFVFKLRASLSGGWLNFPTQFCKQQRNFCQKSCKGKRIQQISRSIVPGQVFSHEISLVRRPLDSYAGGNQIVGAHSTEWCWGLN